MLPARLRLGLAVIAGVSVAVGAIGPASARTQATPKYGGTLVVGLNADPGTLDPTLSNSPAAVGPVFLTMCQTLYDYDAKLQLVPVLAAALPVLSKDKLTYTVELRKGIQFNDGTPFNAQAVVTTVQRNITNPASAEASKYETVDRVTATGPYTVVYHLKKRDSTFEGNPYVLSPTRLAKLGDNFGADPVCVGPFMFDDRVAGDHVTVIKSPYYYDRQDVYLDKIVFKAITNAPAAAAALKAGDVQALNTVSTTELPDIQKNSSLQVLRRSQLGWSGVQINIGNSRGAGNLPYANRGTPLASSPKLRQAFEEAIDRNTLNQVVFAGLYQVSCTMVAPSNTHWYEATKVPCTPYDPKHARKLVAESGFSNPTVRLLMSESTDNSRRAAFIQAQEAAVGINVVIDVVDLPTAAARRRSGDFDVALAGLTTGGVDPASIILLTSSDARNYPGYSNPRLDLILANGLKATDPKARSTLYRAAQQIIHDDRPYIALYTAVLFAAVSTNLTGVAQTYNGPIAVANARFR